MTDSTAPQSPAPLEVVANFLTAQGWSCEQVGELLHTRYRGAHGEWICYAHHRPEADQWLFYSVAPLRAPKVLAAAVAEYLTRANWGLILGNFELDFNDGEVRYKTSIQLNGTAMTAELLHPLIYGNVAVMDRYLPGLQAVISLTQTPAEAIRAIEATAAEEEQTGTN